jgi:hypothetical protein
MKKQLSISVLLLAIFATSTLSFAQIDHWETVVLADDIWRYDTPSAEPSPTWRQLGYNDSGWSQGQGGIGYADGDDNTTIGTTLSLYMRMTFNITDTAKIESAVFHMDYDDAFVAYLNDVEIARANIGTVGDHPAYNQSANTWIEAQMYQGGQPTQFVINKTTLSQILTQGNNILSIQVHNESIGSSDLSAIPFFSVAINDASFTYNNPPNWFNPPIIFSSSDLPIVVIDPGGQTIPDDPRIIAQMGIIDNGVGQRNYLTDAFNDYDGRISIERRGSSSQSFFPKYSYSLETQDSTGANLNVPILGMPVENDWVLHAPYSDKTLMRNYFTYNMGREMGRYYAPRTRLCEVVIDGDYKGTYVMMEKIKRDNDRIDIAKLTALDTAGDNLTGGYILKIDKLTGGSVVDWTSPFAPNFAMWQTTDFINHYPKEADILPVQSNYIENYVTSFETALDGPNFADTAVGYAAYADVGSFIDFLIINEVTRNVDGYRLSTYMHKDKDSNGGKLTMGSVWDFNIALGNADYCDGELTTGWAYDFNSVCSGDTWLVPFWWERLLQDPSFENQLRCRWDELRVGFLNTDTIMDFIDTTAARLDESQQMNFSRWPVLGVTLWPNDFVGQTYQEEVDYLKTWLTNRLIWLDANIGGTCTWAVGVTENENAINVQVSPNPFSSFSVFTFNGLEETGGTIVIHDIIGKQIRELPISGNSLTLYKDDIPAGIYIYSLVQNNTVKATGKLVVE